MKQLMEVPGAVLVDEPVKKLVEILAAVLVSLSVTT